MNSQLPPLPQDRCYFLISPSPRECPHGLEDQQGNFFYVKFGDGNWQTEGRYLTDNPSFRAWQNDSCVTGPSYNHTGNVRAGTYIKGIVCKAKGLTPHGGTEWSKVHSANGNIKQLADDLCKLGDSFASKDLGYYTALNKRNEVLDVQQQHAHWALASAASALKDILDSGKHY